MRPGDVVIADGNPFRITGIYIGGIGVQNLVGIVPLNKFSGSAHGKALSELFVPEELILLADLYRKVEE